MQNLSLAVRIGWCIARAMREPHFFQRFTSRPVDVLLEAGVIRAGSLRISVLVDTELRRHLVIPAADDDEWPSLACQALPPALSDLAARARGDRRLLDSLRSEPDAISASAGCGPVELQLFEDTDIDKHLVVPAGRPVAERTWRIPRLSSPHLRLLLRSS